MVECPICFWKGEEFLSYGIKIRKNAKCPNCESLERHRFLYLYLRGILPRNKYIKLLHFAPERCLADFFHSLRNIDYLSVDLSSNLAMRKEDITNLSLEENTFDIIICSHVLEHIEDDMKAMKELFRILKPGGFALIMVPIDFSRNETFEDFSVTSPEERLKFFGQDNHVRVCGKDYHNRLEKSGFDVDIIKAIEFLKKSEIEKYALSENDFIYSCQKDESNFLIKKILFLKKRIKDINLNFNKINRDYLNKEELENYAKKNKVSLSGFNEKISIITLTHNNDLFLKYFETILKNITYDNFEWVIFANGCGEKYLKSLKEIQDSRVKVIENKKNLSFSKANNLAVKSASGDYLLFLNDDIEGLPNWLENMIETYVENENVGAVGSILIYPQGRHSYQETPASIQHAGIRFNLEREFIRPMNIGKLENPLTIKNDYSIPAVTAACLMIKKDFFNEVEGFDEDYKWGYEDVDLSLKLLQKGYNNFISSKSLLYHYESFTQLADKDREIIRRRSDNVRLFRKKWFKFLYPRVTEDYIENKGFFNFKPLKIGFIVSELSTKALYGDIFTAMGLAKYLRKIGYETYLISKNNPKLLKETNIIISMLDDFNIRLIKNNKIAIKIAWIRNWANKWVRRRWFKDFDFYLASSEKIFEIVENKVGGKTFILRIGADTELFKPCDTDRIKDKSDLVFVGSYWGDKRDVIERLKVLDGFKIRLYGRGWDSFKFLKKYNQGEIGYYHIPVIYGSSKIVLDDQHKETKPYDSINSRVFEALACGKPVVTNANKSITEVLDKGVICTKDEDETLDIIRDLLKDEERLKKMGEEGRKLILAKHSYEVRANEFKSILAKYLMGIKK